jgi:hypothetical protein
MDMRIPGCGHHRRITSSGRHRGVALLIAVLVIALSLVLVVAFMDAAAIEFSLAGSHERYAKALGVADAGLADAVATLSTGGTAADATVSDVEFPTGSARYYSVGVSGSGPLYTVTVAGRASDITRAIEAEVYIGPSRATILRYTEVAAP